MPATVAGTAHVGGSHVLLGAYACPHPAQRKPELPVQFGTAKDLPPERGQLYRGDSKTWDFLALPLLPDLLR